MVRVEGAKNNDDSSFFTVITFSGEVLCLLFVLALASFSLTVTATRRAFHLDTHGIHPTQH
jgi:hypothetical protein